MANLGDMLSNPSYPVHKVVAEDDYFKGYEDYPIYGEVLKNDYDTLRHDLDAKVVYEPKYGDVYLDKETGKFTYKPDADYFGWDSFKYEAFDAYGKSDVAEVKLYIKPVNDAPDAKDDKFYVKETDKLYGNVLKNDTDKDGDDLDVVSYTQPKHGKIISFDKETGDFVYKPDKDKDKYDEKDYFTYKISDGNGGYDTAKVTIHIIDNWSKDKGKDDYHPTPHYDLMA